MQHRAKSSTGKDACGMTGGVHDKSGRCITDVRVVMSSWKWSIIRSMISTGKMVNLEEYSMENILVNRMVSESEALSSLGRPPKLISSVGENL